MYMIHASICIMGDYGKRLILCILKVIIVIGILCYIC